MSWARVPFERIFGAERDLRAAGSALALEGLAIQVRESDADGHPTRVRFVFPTPLERRTWLAWEGTRALPFTPPRPGEQIRLAALSPLEAALTALSSRARGRSASGSARA